MISPKMEKEKPALNLKESRGTRIETVTITLGRDGQLKVTPETLSLKADEKVEVFWQYLSKTLQRGQVEITFPSYKDSPFQGCTFRSVVNGGCLSGPPVASRKRKKPYEYVVKVVTSKAYFSQPLKIQLT